MAKGFDKGSGNCASGYFRTGRPSAASDRAGHGLDWLYEKLSPYFCEDNSRPGTGPVVLVKMVLIQPLFGIPSLRQTYCEIQVNLAYHWFLGYRLLDQIPYWAMVGYTFCKRFSENLSKEFVQHILNKVLNTRMVDPSVIFMDGTHIKASANNKKFQKQKVAQTAKGYKKQPCEEVNAEHKILGKEEIKDTGDGHGPNALPSEHQPGKRLFPPQILTVECS